VSGPHESPPREPAPRRESLPLRAARRLRDLAGAAWRVLPAGVRRRLLAELVRAEQEGDPKGALARLFAVEDRLEMAINTAAMRLDGGLHPKHRLTDYHRFFVDRVNDGERVVDVGCGIGAVAYSVVTRKDVHVIGIDEDGPSIALAKQRFQHPKLEFRCGDARRELPPPPFDAVILSNVLEHIEHRRAFLQGLRVRLEPKRVLVRLPLFERAWTVPMRKELGVRWMSDDTHYDEKTQEGWIAELAEAGLTVGYREIRWGEIWCEAKWEGPLA
jgi:2-polyprenyl-3-methyl-5-hydroxy-6-metoxy-1,4-benzoquinol methylase